MESQGEVIHFTLQDEEENDQTKMQSLDMTGNVTSLMESSRPSENTGLKENTSFVSLHSKYQYEVVKDKINAVCQSFPSLNVRCEGRELILSGDISHITPARLEIKKIIHSVAVRKIVSISNAKAKFLTSRESKEFSEKVFGHLREGTVILDIQEGYSLYAPHNLLDQAETVLKKHLLHDTIRIQANEKDIVTSEPWKKLWDTLMGNTDIKIYFQDNENTDDLILSIVGFTEEVKKAVKECKDVLHLRKNVKEEIDLKNPILLKYLEDLLGLSAAVQISKPKGQTVTLIGPRDEVEKSKLALQKLMEKHIDTFSITKHGAKHYFNNQGKIVLDDVEKKFGCRVFVCNSENKKNKAEGIEQDRYKSESISDKGSNKKEVKRHDYDDKGTLKDGANSRSQKEESPMKRTVPVIQLMLSLGNLENKKANALVAPLLSTRPDLEAMNVTKGLKNKAGQKFSHLFSNCIGWSDNLQSGQCFPMPIKGESYLLNCGCVIFIACQPWDGPDGSSLKALKKGLSDTLNYCHTREMHSVAMSVIGPGKKLCFPPEVAVSIIGEEVKSFVEREPNTTLKKIELAIPTERESLYYICREKLLEMNLGDRIQLCNEDGVTFPKTPIGEYSEVKIGNLSLFVTYNFIKKESTDVIVDFTYCDRNIMDQTFLSVMAQTLFSAGALRNEVVRLEAGSRDLKCKYVMHCNFTQDVGAISVLLKDILLKCEDVGVQSVAIPAIDPGECKLAEEIVAHDMVDAISILTKTRNMTSLASVRLVTLCPSIYHIFCAELRKLSRPVQEASWNPLGLLTARLKDQRLPENDAIKDIPVLQHPLLPPITQLVIVTDKEDKVNDIKCSLEKCYVNAVKYREEKREQPLLDTFSLEEIEKVFSVLSDQIEVGMILNRISNYIIIEGAEKDVIEVAMKVQTNLTAIMTARVQRETKERAGLLVHWGYSDGKDCKPFTMEASQLLEDRYMAGKGDIVIVRLENGEKADVNLETMKAVFEVTKEVVNVVRRDLETETQYPLHWDNMNNLFFMRVKLDPASEEYETVKSNFNKTVNCPIMKIERIQNRFQHTAYTLRKRYITEKNGPCHVNEKNLFHGTAPQNCHSINYSGFSRSFAGQHAAACGNGVYFAENASYSADKTYSPSDPKTGERFIYQVKVLVGRHTKGRKGMKHPPCRTKNDPFDYYDSLSNEDRNPTMFVVFHDDQVYPEYLITFT